MAASLSSQLASLANPEPVLLDPEHDEELLAGIQSKLTDRDDDDIDDDDISVGRSALRTRAVSLLSESDRRYAGKVTSRQQLEAESDIESDDDAGANDEINLKAQQLHELDESDDNVDEQLDDESDESVDDNYDEISSFKERFKQQAKFTTKEKGSDNLDESVDDEGVDDSDDEQNIDDIGDDFDVDYRDGGESGDEIDESKEVDDSDENDKDIDDNDEEIESDGDDLAAFANKFKKSEKAKFYDIGLSEKKEEDEDQTAKAPKGVVKTFSKRAESDVMKGQAVRKQLALMDSLLESRIRVQKVISLVNRLPQPPYDWSMFKKMGGDKFNHAAKLCKKRVREMLECVVQLQEMIHTPSNFESPNNDEDEEISSDDDVTPKPTISESTTVSGSGSTPSGGTESTPDGSTPMIDGSPSKGEKRKLKSKEYPAELNKRHKMFSEYRNGVIEKWSEKTRLATGKFNSKSFSAFDQSALKQIQQICSDKGRLLARTQVKRTSYRVFGKPELTIVEPTIPKDDDTTEAPLREITVERDTEIFDDDDFYHELLRQLIQRKCSDTNDPALLARHIIQINKIRNKVKRDRIGLSSKDRKLKFLIHPKMVSFMAPTDSSDWADFSKDDLFKSLFGQGCNKNQSAGKSGDTIRII